MTRVIPIAALILWTIAMVSGFVLISRYEGTAGATATPPARLTDGMTTDGSKVLIMLAHPQCPCTRASLSELERILAQCGQDVQVHIYFLKPSSVPSDWGRSDLWDRARALPNVQVHHDHEGQKARELGARTSGQVMVFAGDGRLLFSGGITAGRGHEGDNPGRQAVQAVLRGEATLLTKFPVYGCPLFDSCSTTSCCEDPSSCRN